MEAYQHANMNLLVYHLRETHIYTYKSIAYNDTDEKVSLFRQIEVRSQTTSSTVTRN